MAEPLEGLIERLEALNHGSATQPVGTVEWCGATCMALEAAAQALRLLGEVEKALEEIARTRTKLRGDFSLSSKQSDIARSALDKIRKGMGESPKMPDEAGS